MHHGKHKPEKKLFHTFHTHLAFHGDIALDKHHRFALTGNFEGVVAQIVGQRVDERGLADTRLSQNQHVVSHSEISNPASIVLLISSGTLGCQTITRNC